MCIMAEQNFIECVGKTRCPMEHAKFANCWTSFLMSGNYQDPNTRIVYANCDLFLDPMRRCVLAGN